MESDLVVSEARTVLRSPRVSLVLRGVVVELLINPNEGPLRFLTIDQSQLAQMVITWPRLEKLITVSSG